MHGKTLLAVAAAFGAANASPLAKRQGVASSVASAVSSAVVPSGASSAAAPVTSVASSAVSAVSSAVAPVTSTVAAASSTGVSAASSAASSAVSGVSSAVVPTPSGTPNVTGTEANPLYPCPAGYLLTYGQTNQTVPLPVTEATAAAGEWASSPLFPNVTDAMGGTEPGATHTLNVMGIAIPEVLVAAEANATSGFAQWTWNNTAPVDTTPLGAPLMISNYSTVFKAYDPDFTTTQEIGNTTFLQIFTNACIMGGQAEGVTLLETLGQLELSALIAAASSNMTMTNSTMGPESTVVAATSTVAAATTSVPASSSTVAVATSTASQGTSTVSQGTATVSSAVSAASSGASSVASAAASGASSAVSAAAGVTSSA